MMCIQNLVLFCKFVLKILSKNQFLTSIKSRNSFANLRKTMIYTLRVQTHIVIRKKFIFSYNDLDIQIHIFSLLLSA